jgi:serine/threonine-protein kinase
MVQEVAWSPDGRWLVLRTDNGGAGAGDLIGVRTSGDTTPVVLVASPFTELQPAVSPDGRWLAYASNESGTFEVYVRPFPNTNDGRWQVSSGGGSEPRWSGDGRELFFLDRNFSMVGVPVRSTPSFAAGDPHQLFDASGFNIETFHQGYDVSPDGRWFLFIGRREPRAGGTHQSLVLVEHWLTEVEGKVGR